MVHKDKFGRSFLLKISFVFKKNLFHVYFVPQMQIKEALSVKYQLISTIIS